MKLRHGLGKYVRFGPNRVSINCPKASQDLHDVNSNTFKSEVYGVFKHFFGADMSLTTVDHSIHAFRRRVNAVALKPTTIKALGGRVTPHVDYLINSLISGADANATDEAGVWSTGKNMTHSLSYCVTDVMSDLTFSQTLNVQREEKNRHFVSSIPKGVGGMHLVGHSKSTIWSLLSLRELDASLLPQCFLSEVKRRRVFESKLVPRVTDNHVTVQSLLLLNMHKVLFHELITGVKLFMDLSRSFADERYRQYHDEGIRGDDIWEKLLTSHDPATDRTFTREELTSEASLMITGGTDGIIAALTAALFYLTHNPHTLSRLTREVRASFPVPTKTCPIPFASPDLQNITYLTACLDEAMRLSPSVPSILPRRVGPGGMTVDGVHFPAGTNLGIPHYCLHRNAEVFPDPLAYKPERWMSTELQGQTGSDHGPLKPGVGQAFSFTPFGAGRSSCIGRYMAYQEMSYILARIVWELDIRIEPGNTLGEGTGSSSEGRQRKDEFQIYCCFVSWQDGPVLQFRRRRDLVSGVD